MRNTEPHAGSNDHRRFKTLIDKWPSAILCELMTATRRRRVGFQTYLRLSLGVFIISVLYYVFSKLLDLVYGNFNVTNLNYLLLVILLFIFGFAVYLWVVDRDGFLARMLGVE